ncbi:MAG: hypothetical protein ACOYNL_10325 [Rickettsiales bacterium]
MSYRKRPSHERTLVGDGTTCRTAIWDYLIWGDVAYTFFEWVARKCVHFVIKGNVDILFTLLAYGHIFYIAYAMHTVYTYKYHSTQPKLSRIIPLFLLVYAVACILTYLATSMPSPISYTTLNVINGMVAAFHG